jgi:8-oxo-dGTP diphosphatase
MRPLRVIAAAVLNTRGLLLVSKHAAPEVFYLPGGKPEPGEAPLARLTGMPQPAAEIAALRWWPAEPAPRLAPAISGCVIPRLRSAGRL